MDRRVDAEKVADHYPEAPEVAPLVVHQILVTVRVEGLHTLGRHELRAVQEHEQQRRGLRAPARVELAATRMRL